jgi:predicted component of type VI protein secretion system
MSTNGFQVLMSDLLNAATVFQEQSGVLSRVMPAGGPVVPDGGGADINQAMQAATQKLGSLNAQLAAAISQHATRLREAHTEYANSENDVENLAYQITNPDSI